MRVAKAEARNQKSEKGSRKLRVAVMLAVFMLMAAAVSAQSAPDGNATHDSAAKAATSPTTSTKMATTSGRIADDGKTFVADSDNAVWQVLNPNAISGTAGMRVTLRARMNAASRELEVASVRVENSAGVRLHDAAFRR